MKSIIHGLPRDTSSSQFRGVRKWRGSTTFSKHIKSGSADESVAVRRGIALIYGVITGFCRSVDTPLPPVPGFLVYG